MKSNEITEGIWDDMKSGYKAGKQDYIRKQAEKMGMAAAPAAPPEPENPIKVQHDHIDQMFKSGRLSKPAYDMAKAKLPPLPTKKSGFYTDLRNLPPKAATSTPAATPTTPKAGDPVPGMSGHVYSGEVGPTGKPKVIPAPAAPTAEPATAPTTLPTKAKSKTKAKDIDIDAALKMADTLSPDEKKKLLQDLLKSGVKISAGGA